MADRIRLNRRRVLGATVAGASSLAASGTLLQETLAARRAPAFIQMSGKITYWGGLIFAEAANKLLEDAINQWGDDNGVETEVVMINTNDMNARISAAVESDTMPDAADLFLETLFLLANQEGILAPVDDLYTQLGEEHGGWYDSYAAATDTTALAGSRLAIPYGGIGNFVLRRNDALTEAGFTEPPATWQELMDQAIAVNAPPLYGFGLPIGNVNDANVGVSILQAYGGRVADDEGKMVTIDSPATRAYLDWVKQGWDARVYPPGNTVWDGTGDNTAYLGGQAAFVLNTGSIAISAKNDDPELYEATAYSPMPAGPAMTVGPVNPSSRVISAKSQNIDAAKALIAHLATPEFIRSYFEVATFAPALKNQATFDIFDGRDPILAVLADINLTGTPPGAPDVYNTAFGEVNATFIIPKMILRVVVDGYDFDRAIAEAQAAAQAIYDKYN